MGKATFNNISVNLTGSALLVGKSEVYREYDWLEQVALNLYHINVHRVHLAMCWVMEGV